MSFPVDTSVAAGAALLDEKMQGWTWKIDLATLDVGDRHLDPLGQIYGDYVRGCDALGLSRVEKGVGGSDDSQRKRMIYGFSTNIFSDVVLLTEEWRRVIAERRAV